MAWYERGMSERDLEEACWRAHDAAEADGQLPNCLKALDLLVKIRLAGDRVKGQPEQGKEEDSALKRVHDLINGG